VSVLKFYGEKWNSGEIKNENEVGVYGELWLDMLDKNGTSQC